MTRIYESRFVDDSGLLGPGFDFNWNDALCELPATSVPAGYKLPITDYGNPSVDRVATAGDLLYVDGSGSVHLYRRIDAQHGNTRRAARSSRPIPRSRRSTGPARSRRSTSRRTIASTRSTASATELRALASNGTRTLFDGAGRLTDLIPPFVDSRLQLRTAPNGKLAQVEGDRGIALEFGYRGPTTSPDFVNALDLPFSGPARPRATGAREGRSQERRVPLRRSRPPRARGEDPRPRHGYGWDPAAPDAAHEPRFRRSGTEEPRAAIDLQSTAW